MKRIFALLATFALVAGFAAAQSTPAAPAVGITFTQVVSGETVDGLAHKTEIVGANQNAGYLQSNIKGQVDFDLGGGVKLSPWTQERLETRADGGVGIRNRFYVGLNSAFAIDKAFNLGVNLEYRHAYVVATAATLPEQRFTPYLILSGAIDPLYYSITEDLPIYLDSSSGKDNSNDQDNSYFELEGTYNIGVGLKLDSVNTLKIELNDYLDMPNFTANTKAQGANAAAVVQLTKNEFRPKVILASGSIAPFAGFLMSTYLDKNGKTTSNIVGGSFGVALKAGSGSFNLQADLGTQTAPKADNPNLDTGKPEAFVTASYSTKS